MPMLCASLRCSSRRCISSTPIGSTCNELKALVNLPTWVRGGTKYCRIARDLGMLCVYIRPSWIIGPSNGALCFSSALTSNTSRLNIILTIQKQRIIEDGVVARKSSQQNAWAFAKSTGRHVMVISHFDSLQRTVRRPAEPQEAPHALSQPMPGPVPAIHRI